VTFTASATGGTEPVEFKWLVFDGVSSLVVNDWSTTATFAWTPATANASYSVSVWVRSAGNGEDVPEQTAEMPFPIVAPPLSGVTLTANRPVPQLLGTAVTFTATATGGVEPVEFKWLVNDGVSSTVASEWSTSATFVWAPATANLLYSVTVWARSAGNANDVPEQTATMAFPILPNPLAGLLTMAADKKSPEKPGTTVTFTAAVVGAVTPVQFKWLVFNGVAWTVASEWSTTATFAWTPATANGSYKVSVWARSAGSTADAAEKSAEMAFPIRGKAPKVRMAHREERKDHREERKDHGEERKDHERDRSRR
jgi:hypothetical protein